MYRVFLLKYVLNTLEDVVPLSPSYNTEAEAKAFWDREYWNFEVVSNREVHEEPYLLEVRDGLLFYTDVPPLSSDDGAPVTWNSMPGETTRIEVKEQGGRFSWRVLKGD